jgi:hypothetical protein
MAAETLADAARETVINVAARWLALADAVEAQSFAMQSAT